VLAEALGKAGSFYREHWGAIIVVSVLVPLLVFVLGLIFFPHAFWDDFLYKYFWGPVVSDAQGKKVSGVAEGYNLINTVVYAILLGIGLLVLYKGFRLLKVDMDQGFLLCSLPMFIFGGVARVMEDSFLLHGTVQVFFISPLIYPVVIVLFALAVTGGLIIRRHGGWSGRQRTLTFGALILSILVLYFLVTDLLSWDFSYVINPLVPLAIGLLSILLFLYVTQRGLEQVKASVLCIGLFCLLTSVAYMIMFNFQPAWQATFVLDNGRALQPHPEELFIIPAIALGLTFLVYLTGHLPHLVILAMPANLLMFMAHFLDGAATSQGIELFGYAEKHVLPTYLISLAGTAAIMLPIKFLMVLAIVFIIDVLFKKELDTHPGLAMTMKFAVVFLGLAPGVRDTLRIALGV
jgi:uncharacterized membrane protein